MSTTKRRANEMNYSNVVEDSDDEDMAPNFDGTEEAASSFDEVGILESASILSGVVRGKSETPPKRKRQKLTHLTEDEKLMRRKLKNR